MSKQSDAKTAQGYCETPHSCANCKHFSVKRETKNSVFGGTWEKISERRCGIGRFAVKMTASCKQFEPK